MILLWSCIRKENQHVCDLVAYPLRRVRYRGGYNRTWHTQERGDTEDDRGDVLDRGKQAGGERPKIFCIMGFGVE